MPYSYRTVQPQDYEHIRQFLSENGWAHRVADPEQFTKMLDNSDRAVVVWDKERIVGFGRALCDDVSNGYISMVAVAEEAQGQGVGREIVQCLIGSDSIGSDSNITWMLRAGRGSEGFWQKMGFAASEIAMERTWR